MAKLGHIRFIYKPVLFFACLLPFAWLLARALQLGGLDLGANPVEEIQDTLGIWGLRLLLATLAITPLRLLTGLAWLLQFRRMLGLFAFFYVALHFLNYLVLDQTLSLALIVEDIVKRPFITIGFSAFVLLVPLAVTSTAGWRRRLRHRWQQLHYSIYLVGILVCWHFYWQVKKDISEPLIYIVILTALLIPRLLQRRKRRQKARSRQGAGGSTGASTLTRREIHE